MSVSTNKSEDAIRVLSPAELLAWPDIPFPGCCSRAIRIGSGTRQPADLVQQQGGTAQLHEYSWTVIRPYDAEGINPETRAVVGVS